MPTKHQGVKACFGSREDWQPLEATAYDGCATLDFFSYICRCTVAVVGRRIADKRSDCHPGASYLIEHAHTAMPIGNSLFITADPLDKLRDPLSENTQINDLKLC